MNRKTIATALICSALVLGTCLSTMLCGTRDAGIIEVSQTGGPSGLTGGNLSIGYILSTVSADFALPGRPLAV